MTHQFTLIQHVNRPPDAVFYAFTNSPMLAEWWCDWAFLTPHRGRTLYMYWETGFQAMGQYLEVIQPERLAFTWIDGASPACNAAVTFTGTDGDTRVELAYTDIDNENQRHQLETHWRQGLENLASVLETGIDLRIVRRPMLGVYLGELVNEEIAGQYGTSHGIILEGTLSGLSAEAAGLQAGDVLVEAGARPLADYNDLTRTLVGRTVGDVVEVGYIRNGERHSAAMELKAQTLADIPRDPDALADQLAAIYADVDRELAAMLNGVTEEQAATMSTVEEWSIRHIVAHLIANERDTQTTISMRAGGFGEVFSYFNNSMTRIKPVLATYPTLPELTAALTRAEAETVATVRHLSTDFVGRRGSYDRLGRTLLEEAGTHPRDHIAQIERIKGALVQTHL